MIGFDEALAIVCEQARPLERVRVPVMGANRRVLAEKVIAPLDAPPSDVSAMDGYALRNADLNEGHLSYRVVGESFAGAGFKGLVNSGECVRIFTGAPIPDGTDRVVIQENVGREGDTATIGDMGSGGWNVRKRGSDFSTGALLIEEGRLIDARVLVVAAAADRSELIVWRRPRVSILGTGDELVKPGEARQRHGTIPESISAGLSSLVDLWGGRMGIHALAGDNLAQIAATAEAGLEEADVLVMTGGASVGEKDYAKTVLANMGLELLFSKVAIRPGKPVWFGRIGEKLVVGLPGNPTSAMVTARLFLAPLIAGLSGRAPRSALRWRTAPLKDAIQSGGERETFARARWSGGEVQPLADQDSGAQKALADAELLIRRRPNAVAVGAGTVVEVLDF